MKKIQIFLGGGVKLLHGENAFLKGYRTQVIDPAISQLNSREYVKHLFVAKDYSDLTRNVVQGKHQDVYNSYILHDAQIALFIVDGEIGDITKHEIDIAIASTKKSRHPIVYVYGKNIKEGNELLDYLNQECIYYQHFFDDRDLSTKIKADLDAATATIDRQFLFRFWTSIVLSMLFCSSAFFMIKNCTNNTESALEKCTAQLYLMRYTDINALTGTSFFSDSVLADFKYEDSIMTGSNIAVFPIMRKNSVITSTPPFFRLKLNNKHRNTIVFVEAKLEVDKYVRDSVTSKMSFKSLGDMPDVCTVNVKHDNSEYLLKGFRHNVAYGETDDRFFFSVLADECCSFRMRVRAKSQLGDYLYSNYIYVKYIR